MATVFGLAGGLGLFIFGMQTLSEGLQKVAGDRIRKILERLTGTMLVAVPVGAVVTAIVQSSSATTVMVIGFVNAGVMTLREAVGVILGANIGTTVTAQLVAFELTDYALPAVGVGLALMALARTRTQRYFGQILFGFGLLFLGMGTMSAAVRPLHDSPVIENVLASFGRHRIAGVLVGLGVTAMIQSSSAMTGIIIALAGQRLLDLDAALPLILGTNVGTCITALLGAIGTSVTARRAAVAHLLFNVGGVLLFLPVLPAFAALVRHTAADLPREVANAHTLFNVINTFIVLPFIDRFTALVSRCVPGEDAPVLRGPRFLDKRMLGSPAIALAQARKEVIRMAGYAGENVADVRRAFLEDDTRLLRKAERTEEAINELEMAVTEYLAALSQRSLTPWQSQEATWLLHMVNDVERVGDHARDIARLTATKIEEELPFSQFAVTELREMFGLAEKCFGEAIRSLETNDEKLAREVMGLRDEIDAMEKALRQNHIRRLNEGKCYPASGVVYLDILSNLERIGDHAADIARVVLREL